MDCERAGRGLSRSARGPTSGLAKILARHLHADAHLGEAGAHAVADAVAEGLLAGGALGIGFRSAAGRQIGIIGGDDGGLLVVVARVEDEGDGIPDPLIGLLRAQVVEHENFGGEDRLEQLEFGGVHLRVVAVLDVLEQLAIVAEEAFDAALLHQAAQNADGKMGFARRRWSR